MSEPSQADINDTIESALRICNGFSLVTCANIFSAAMLNMATLTSQKNNGEPSATEIQTASLFFIETIAVQTRDVIAQLQAVTK